MSLNQLARRILGVGSPGGVDGFAVRYRHGSIVAVHAGNSPVLASVDVDIAGTTVSGVKYLDSYGPAAGDEVEMMQIGPGVFLVIGKCQT